MEEGGREEEEALSPIVNSTTPEHGCPVWGQEVAAHPHIRLSIFVSRAESEKEFRRESCEMTRRAEEVEWSFESALASASE